MQRRQPNKPRLYEIGLNANLGRVSHPDEILVQHSRLFGRESWTRTLKRETRLLPDPHPTNTAVKRNAHVRDLRKAREK